MYILILNLVIFYQTTYILIEKVYTLLKGNFVTKFLKSKSNIYLKNMIVILYISLCIYILTKQYRPKIYKNCINALKCIIYEGHTNLDIRCNYNIVKLSYKKMLKQSTVLNMWLTSLGSFPLPMSTWILSLLLVTSVKLSYTARSVIGLLCKHRPISALSFSCGSWQSVFRVWLVAVCPE